MKFFIFLVASLLPLHAQQTITLQGIYDSTRSPTLVAGGLFYSLNLVAIPVSSRPAHGNKIEITGTLKRGQTLQGEQFFITVQQLTILDDFKPLYHDAVPPPEGNPTARWGHDGYGVGRERQTNDFGVRPPQRNDPFVPLH